MSPSAIKIPSAVDKQREPRADQIAERRHRDEHQEQHRPRREPPQIFLRDVEDVRRDERRPAPVLLLLGERLLDHRPDLRRRRAHVRAGRREAVDERPGARLVHEVADDVVARQHVLAQRLLRGLVLRDRPHEVVGADAALLRIGREVLHVRERQRVPDALRRVEARGRRAHPREEVLREDALRLDPGDRHVEPAEPAVHVLEDPDVGVPRREEREHVIVLLDLASREHARDGEDRDEDDDGPRDGLLDQPTRQRFQRRAPTGRTINEAKMIASTKLGATRRARPLDHATHEAR
jgi:hypothetical protein